MKRFRMVWFALLVSGALLGLSAPSGQAADEGWLTTGQTFQTKAEKGKILSVKASTKKGIVCVLVNSGKKNFDWDLTNNMKMSIEPFTYATPEKPNFTVKVDHCDYPEGKLWYSYKKP